MIVNTRFLFTRLLPVMRINAVCDVGSMDGTDARRFRTALPRANIYAFEPHPENFRRMQTNSALQNSHIALAPLAVTNYDGMGELFAVNAGYVPGEAWRGMSSLHRRLHTPDMLTAMQVETVRLDTFLAGKAGPDLRLALWIDSEGMAYEVIEGAAGVLRNTYLLHLEVETAQCIGAVQRFYPEVKALLGSAGFVELARDGHPGQLQFNALFVRAELPAIMGFRTRQWLALALLRRVLGMSWRKVCPGCASWLDDRRRAGSRAG